MLHSTRYATLGAREMTMLTMLMIYRPGVDDEYEGPCASCPWPVQCAARRGCEAD